MATSPYSIDLTTYLDELLAQASPDLLREMLQGFINQILSTQANQVCGADYASVSDARTNVRTAFLHRYQKPSAQPLLAHLRAGTQRTFEIDINAQPTRR